MGKIRCWILFIVLFSLCSSFVFSLDDVAVKYNGVVLFPDTQCEDGCSGSHNYFLPWNDCAQGAMKEGTLIDSKYRNYKSQVGAWVDD